MIFTNQHKLARHQTWNGRASNTGVLKGGQRCEEDARVDDPLAQVGGKDEDVILPPRILELKRGDESVTNGHQNGTGPHQREELAPSRHDDSGDESADGSC